MVNVYGSWMMECGEDLVTMLASRGAWEYSMAMMRVYWKMK